MTVISVITARAGSKGVPGKNIRILGGHPLLAYPIHAARSSQLLDSIIVSTDSPEYAKIAKHYGAEVPRLRPAYLAEDVPSEDVLEYEVEQYEKERGCRVDIVVLQQPTTPLVTSTDIDSCISTVEKDWAQTALTVTQAVHSPYWQFIKSDSGRMRLFVSGKIAGDRGVRQALPKTFVPNGMCYAVKRDYLMRNHRIIGSKCYGIEVPDWRSHDIDFELDFAIIEAIIRQRGETREWWWSEWPERVPPRGR